MTNNERDLISLKENGMIDEEAFNAMWMELQSQTNDPAESISPQVAHNAREAAADKDLNNSALNLVAGAYSVKGIRPQNEDSFLLGTETGGTKEIDQNEFSANGEGPFFFAVADGMGGHDAGDIASSFIVNKLKISASNQIESVNDRQIAIMLKEIHAQLLADARSRATPKMGSTISGIVLQKDNSGFFNAGDSRVYRLRHNYIQQLTEDDSLSRFVPGAAKNIITNAIGAGQENLNVASRFSQGFAVKGDIFLMCSDGVHGFLSDDELTFLLSLDTSPQDIARTIVEKAIQNNSDDNCTAVVVKYL